MITEMVVIKYHFELKNTYILGNWCKNGCQIFHKDNSDSVFQEFQVPKEKQNDVISRFSDEKVDYDSVLKNCIPANIPNVIRLCDDIEFLKSICLGNSTVLKSIVADKGVYELCDILKLDEDYFVRSRVARHNFPDILEYLEYDKSSSVRRQVTSTIEKIRKFGAKDVHHN